MRNLRYVIVLLLVVGIDFPKPASAAIGSIAQDANATALETVDPQSIINHLVGRTVLTSPSLDLADENRDDKVDISDVITAFFPKNGVVVVTATPKVGSWTLTGPAGFEGNGHAYTADHIFSDAPLGDYTLNCDDNVPGEDPPTSVVKTLESDGVLLFTPQWMPEVGPITIYLPGNVPLELVTITSGTFQMGSPNSERGRDSDEGPTHTVNIAYSYRMGKTEVTQKQWLAVMGGWPGTAPSSTYGVGNNYPAYYISWNDCQNFVTALNQYIRDTGQGPARYRMPSEAEWEYACRAGTQTRFFFGDSLSVNDGATDGPAGILPGNRSDYMWYQFNCQGDANGAYGTKPVATKLPNQFGLYDMHGNVWEWCQDWTHSDYIGAPTDGSAWEVPAGTYRALRSGDWGRVASICRSANFNTGYGRPDDRDKRYGFRLAR